MFEIHCVLFHVYVDLLVVCFVKVVFARYCYFCLIRRFWFLSGNVLLFVLQYVFAIPCVLLYLMCTIALFSWSLLLGLESLLGNYCIIIIIIIIYIYIYTYIHTHSMCIYKCMNIYIYMYTYIHIVYIYIYIIICSYYYIYIYIYYVCISLSLSIYIYIYTIIYELCMCRFICVHA